MNDFTRIGLVVLSLVSFACGGPLGGQVTAPAGGNTQSVTAQEPMTCPSVTDPAVWYLSHEVSTCAASLFSCPAGQTSFDDACGCGCTASTPPACPDPSSPRVHYMSRDLGKCAAIFFACEPGQRTIDEACGCGCLD
jgi:hypothetical protein